MVKRSKKKWFRHGSWWRRLRNNRKYRDVLFRHLFRDKKDLLELYNALNGRSVLYDWQFPESLRAPEHMEPEYALAGNVILCPAV